MTKVNYQSILTKVIKFKNLPCLAHWPLPHLQGGQKTWLTHQSATSWSPEFFSCQNILLKRVIELWSFSSLISINFWNVCFWSSYKGKLLPANKDASTCLFGVCQHSPVLIKYILFVNEISTTFEDIYIVNIRLSLWNVHTFLVGDFCKFSKLCNSVIISTYIVCLLVGYD